MIIWLSHDWMLCSRERARTLQVMVGEMNKAFVVETEWLASKGTFWDTPVVRCKTNKGTSVVQNPPSRLEQVAPHELLTWEEEVEICKRVAGKKLRLRENTTTAFIPSTLKQPKPHPPGANKQQPPAHTANANMLVLRGYAVCQCSPLLVQPVSMFTFDNYQLLKVQLWLMRVLEVFSHKNK